MLNMSSVSGTLSELAGVSELTTRCGHSECPQSIFQSLGLCGAGAKAGPSRPMESSAGPSRLPAALRGPPSGGQLWVEKHKPKAIADLVGNGTLVATLRQWLQDW